MPLRTQLSLSPPFKNLIKGLIAERPFCLSSTLELCRNPMILITPSDQAAALRVMKGDRSYCRHHVKETGVAFRLLWQVDIISTTKIDTVGFETNCGTERRERVFPLAPQASYLTNEYYLFISPEKYSHTHIKHQRRSFSFLWRTQDSFVLPQGFSLFLTACCQGLVLTSLDRG